MNIAKLVVAGAFLGVDFLRAIDKALARPSWVKEEEQRRWRSFV